MARTAPLSPFELRERLMSHVTPEPNSGCWLWTGLLAPDGYANLSIAGATRRAHRSVWEAMVGPIPAGLHLDHLCRTRSCVNPSHLEPVTPQENYRRGMGRSAVSARENRCLNGHEFTPENTYVGRQGGRTKRKCLACNALRTRLTNERKRKIIMSRIETDRLLSRWMSWASGVAFKSPEGEKLVVDTDAFLSRPGNDPRMVNRVSRELHEAMRQPTPASDVKSSPGAIPGTPPVEPSRCTIYDAPCVSPEVCIDTRACCAGSPPSPTGKPCAACVGVGVRQFDYPDSRPSDLSTCGACNGSGLSTKEGT